MTVGTTIGAILIVTAAISATPVASPNARQPPLGTAERNVGQGIPGGADVADRDGSAPLIAIRDKDFGTPVVDAKFDAGMAAIRANNPAAAVELMRPVLADFARRYASERRPIYCALTPEQVATYRTGAARAGSEMVTIDARWCRAQYVTAYALIDLDRLPEALAAFQRLVGFAPRNSRYLNELGYVLMTQKKWRDSLEVYRRSEAAADLSPDRVKEERCLALKGMGYNLVELGDYDAADAAYHKCLDIDPSDTDSPRELDYIAQQRKLTV